MSRNNAAEVPQDDSYVSAQDDAGIPVQSDSSKVEDPIDERVADSDEQLERDDKDAIDSSNVIEERTRGAKPSGTYTEPGDDEGLPGPEDGKSAVAQTYEHGATSESNTELLITADDICTIQWYKSMLVSGKRKLNSVSVWLELAYQPRRATHQRLHSQVQHPSFFRPEAFRTKMKPSAFQGKPQEHVKKYKYSPLDVTQGSIRLLRLMPAADPYAPIQCSLFHTNIADAPPYIALSYAWGDRSSKRIVSIGGEELYVTANLKYALRRLRPRSPEDAPLVMWVDAVCINQADIPERNFQTANMRTIYQNADSVAVWLGNTYKESQEAIRLARDLAACSSAGQVEDMIKDPKNEQHLRALVSLFRRQYWWRIWVIQEVSCGKEAKVYCGEDEISWDDLDRVCDVLKTQEARLHSLFYKTSSYVRTLTTGGPRGLQLSRYSSDTVAPPLLELLISHKSKKSTDPKDKVYALVGISDSRYNFGKIDYSKPIWSIYAHTARHIISKSLKLDVICIKQHDVPELGLPSWAPNWTRASSHVIIGLHHRVPEFAAAADTLADAEFISHGLVLKASGIKLDKVKVAGMPLRKKGAPGDAIPPLHVFHDWWNLFVAIHSNSTVAQAVFARTISCGHWNLKEDDEYAAKLESIFALSEDMLSDSDILRLDPPSRTSTISRSTSRTNSFQTLDDEDGDNSETDIEEKEQVSTILAASLMMNQRRLILSDGGLVGLGPWNAQEGDIICVLLGCRFPVVLRKTEQRYILIGEAYVDGFMDGKCVDGLQTGEYTLETFEIE